MTTEEAIESNKNMVSELEKERGCSFRELLEKQKLRDEVSVLRFLYCPVCGKDWRITFPIMKYFDYDVSRIVCHHCQNENKQWNKIKSVA